MTSSLMESRMGFEPITSIKPVALQMTTGSVDVDKSSEKRSAIGGMSW